MEDAGRPSVERAGGRHAGPAIVLLRRRYRSRICPSARRRRDRYKSLPTETSAWWKRVSAGVRAVEERRRVMYCRALPVGVSLVDKPPPSSSSLDRRAQSSMHADGRSVSEFAHDTLLSFIFIRHQR